MQKAGVIRAAVAAEGDEGRDISECPGLPLPFLELRQPSVNNLESGRIRYFNALTHVGIAFLPEKSWGNLSQNSSFRLVHVDFPHCTRTLYVSWHDSSENMDAIMLFVSYAKEYFKKL